MYKLIECNCNLEQLNIFSQKFAQKASIGDIIFLKGELGAGKTTFARFFINALFDNLSIQKPKIIKSPSFPIMINYSLLKYEIFHYDLFRLKNVNELSEIDIFENLQQNIIIVEWPELIMNHPYVKSYYLIEFKLIDLSKRYLKMFHSKKKKFNEF
ncbi:tRNA (adenosine(37)-N6)-threonylcarbamoyltransferase complex ATPase subunit type 1 TsaE [Alphaproteobacteria bacterium]|nr:tRNA (adenosine(37)-N6)-threonylcarbamoyltransferase complex ATPase subunit type 1 TsaE [Alphaproteobacteria bacterium]